jgi:hypothetical protein
MEPQAERPPHRHGNDGGLIRRETEGSRRRRDGYIPSSAEPPATCHIQIDGNYGIALKAESRASRAVLFTEYDARGTPYHVAGEAPIGARLRAFPLSPSLLPPSHLGSVPRNTSPDWSTEFTDLRRARRPLFSPSRPLREAVSPPERWLPAGIFVPLQASEQRKEHRLRRLPAGSQRSGGETMSRHELLRRRDAAGPIEAGARSGGSAPPRTGEGRGQPKNRGAALDNAGAPAKLEHRNGGGAIRTGNSGKV